MEHIHNGCDDRGFDVGGTKKEVWASRGRGLLLNEDDHDTARPPTESLNVISYLTIHLVGECSFRYFSIYDFKY